MMRAEARMRNWLVGQGLLMVILGSLSALVFGLLRIKYFYALAVFAGLANIVPIVGPLASLSLAAIVAGREVTFDAVVRIDTPGEADYYRNGGILPFVLRQLVRS